MAGLPGRSQASPTAMIIWTPKGRIPFGLAAGLAALLAEGQIGPARSPLDGALDKRVI